MQIMKQGDVMLTPIPQADGQIKNRPALFLRELPPFFNKSGKPGEVVNPLTCDIETVQFAAR